MHIGYILLEFIDLLAERLHGVVIGNEGGILRRNVLAERHIFLRNLALGVEMHFDLLFEVVKSKLLFVE